jgi:hypothetical protein
VLPLLLMLLLLSLLLMTPLLPTPLVSELLLLLPLRGNRAVCSDILCERQ